MSTVPQSNDSAPPAAGAPTASAAEIAANVQLSHLAPDQVLQLLRSLPGVFNKQLVEQGNLKEAAAETLSNLAQASPTSIATAAATFAPVYPPPHPGSAHGLPAISDPGPSSHPRGPPNLGQLSALASAVQGMRAQAQEAEEEAEEGGEEGQGSPSSQQNAEQQQEGGGAGGQQPTSTSRPRGRNINMGSEEWARQRKDNHVRGSFPSVRGRLTDDGGMGVQKEVERRRRGNINEGINELGRIVPNGSGEKAKGAILSRAVQYIHHLKENEARNIEKWTLEKLLMDQAMGDLQAQLEEMRRMWDEERTARQRLESELEVLRGIQTRGGASAQSAAEPAANIEAKVEKDAKDGKMSASADEDEARLGKRQRTE
ncbi:hypothetical protein EVG20_g6973 [Dentipellis fragilis]|uniref:BHLH domain-containing protein n=1 Tax=Dentipellis fragilis TaxID=205917 RepID=A0A4Y9YJN6_9AGAM|nr:hypothetical protein EVG20_g6973 [Dentipellis fragilis]